MRARKTEHELKYSGTRYWYQRMPYDIYEERVCLSTVGIIGCGTLGTEIAILVERIVTECNRLILFDIDFERAHRLRRSLHIKTEIVRNIEDMLCFNPTVIVEAASRQAVKDYIEQVVHHEIDFIVLSTGALLDCSLTSSKIHLVPGAIGGIDAISSAALAGIEKAVLTSRKNPRTLKMANRKEKLVFKGDAEKAAELFPKIMNVAATLSLIVKPARAEVHIVSDPKVDRIEHELRIQWKHGEMRMQFSNETYPRKPQTSILTTYSVISILKSILDH